MKVRTKPTRSPENVNISRVDPTRTTMLRREWERAVSKRWDMIKVRILKRVVDENGFGVTVNAQWAGLPQDEQLKGFQDWLAQQFNDQLLNNTATDLWKEFVVRGFLAGAGRAFQDFKAANGAALAKPVPWFGGQREQFLSTAFNNPIAVEKVKLLVARTMTELRGVTEATRTQITRVLADGLARGDSPRKVGAEIANTVDGIGKARAVTIARTETIRAHAEGQLIALQQLGVTEVGVMVEWATAKDKKVCSLCRPLQGIVLKVQEATGLIPRHPNCRCAWVPANVGEDGENQKRSKAQISVALAASIGKKGDWGKGVSISDVRPEAITANKTIHDMLNPPLIDVSWIPIDALNAFSITYNNCGPDSEIEERNR